MSQDVLEMVCEMEPDGLQRLMAMQCAPVITGEKISNLIMLSNRTSRQVYKCLEHTDLKCFSLFSTSSRTALLIYNQKSLESVLKNTDICDFLHDCGYEALDVKSALQQLRERYVQCRRNGEDFPHEMGVFLGYPLEDILGFIQNQGENYLCTGFWKVYSDPQKKINTFDRFYSARDKMVRMLHMGFSLDDILNLYQEKRSRLAACL